MALSKAAGNNSRSCGGAGSNPPQPPPQKKQPPSLSLAQIQASAALEALAQANSPDKRLSREERMGIFASAYIDSLFSLGRLLPRPLSGVMIPSWLFARYLIDVGSNENLLKAVRNGLFQVIGVNRVEKGLEILNPPRPKRRVWHLSRKKRREILEQPAPAAPLIGVMPAVLEEDGRLVIIDKKFDPPDLMLELLLWQNNKPPAD